MKYQDTLKELHDNSYKFEQIFNLLFIKINNSPFFKTNSKEDEIDKFITILKSAKSDIYSLSNTLKIDLDKSGFIPKIFIDNVSKWNMSFLDISRFVSFVNIYSNLIYEAIDNNIELSDDNLIAIKTQFADLLKLINDGVDAIIKSTLNIDSIVIYSNINKQELIYSEFLKWINDNKTPEIPPSKSIKEEDIKEKETEQIEETEQVLDIEKLTEKTIKKNNKTK